jgi:tetratricopeptide (TPR) repeat protein
MSYGLVALAIVATFPAQPVPTIREDLYRIWVREGLKRQDARRWDAAAVCYRRALEYRPDGRDALFGLAYSLSKSGKVAESEAALKRLLARYPDEKNGALLLARLLRARGAADQAVQVLRNAATHSPNDAQIAQEIGAALLQASKPSQALPHLVRSLGAGNDTYAVRILLGRCHALLADPVQAEHHLLKALSFRPKDPTAALYLLDVYLSSGRWLDAMALAEGQTKAWPTDWRFWWALAQSGLRLADSQTAIRGVRNAIKFAPKPNQHTLRLRAAKMGLEADMPEVTVAAIEAGEAPDAEMSTYLARAYEALKRWREAAASWEQASKARVALLCQAALCWERAGDTQRALKCLDRVGEKEPAALAEAARIAVSVGNVRAGESYLRRLLAQAPQAPNLHLILAELLAARGEIVLALGQARQAIPMAPAEAWRTLGALYERAGLKRAGARAYLTAWEQSRQTQDAEAAALLLRQLGDWPRLSSLLQSVSKPTDALKVEAGWLALAQDAPERALKTVSGVVGPDGAHVRAIAKQRLGYPSAVDDAVEALRNSDANHEQLLQVFAEATKADANTRRAAIDKLLSLLEKGLVEEKAVEILDGLIEAEYGSQGKVERWVELARTSQAAIGVVRKAAELLADAGRVELALGIVEGQLAESADKPPRQLCLLGLAARLCLHTGLTTKALDYLSRGAALRQQPLIVARLAVLAHTEPIRSATYKALQELATVWEAGGSDVAALFRFMLAAADEADVDAWVASYEGSKEEKALLASARAMARGEPHVALVRLEPASEGRERWQLEAEALLRLGRPAEAEAPVSKLLRHAPGPDAFELSGATAAQLGDWEEAAWWYARAVAAQPDNLALTAALARAAERAQLDRNGRRDLACRAAAYAPSAQARSRVLQSLLVSLAVSEAQVQPTDVSTAP